LTLFFFSLPLFFAFKSCLIFLLLPRALFVEYFHSDLIAYATKKKKITCDSDDGDNPFIPKEKATNARYAAHKPTPRAAQGNPTAGNV
jgi:hypothetical protein